MNYYTLEEFLKLEEIPDGLLRVTVLKGDKSLGDIPSVGFLYKTKYILFVKKTDANTLEVQDKDEEINEELSKKLTELYKVRHPDRKEEAPLVTEVPKETLPVLPKEKTREQERLKEIETLKASQLARLEALRKQLDVARATAAATKKKIQEAESPLSICDKKYTLLEFLFTSLEEFQENKLYCVEDLLGEHALIPKESQQHFIIEEEKLHFYTTVKVTRDTANKITGFNMAIFKKNMEIHKELSVRLSKAYVGFNSELEDRQATGLPIKKVSELTIPVVKAKGVVKLTERVYEKDDSQKIKELKNQLFDEMDKILLLNKNGAEPTIPPVEQYSSLHLLDDSLLKIIPFEHLKKVGNYYYAKNDVIEFAKTVVDKKDIKDFDPSYKIINDVDIQIIKQEIIRRHFFDIKMKDMKDNYIKNLESLAAIKHFELTETGISIEELIDSVRKKFEETKDKSEKSILQILFNKAAEWYADKDEVNRLRNQSLLSETDIYLVQHDIERIKEEDDMSKADSIYPPMRHVDMNIFTSEEADQYRIHYHSNATTSELKDEYNLEFVSAEALANLLMDTQKFNIDTMRISCYREPEKTEIGCKRPYTLYQIWRAIRHTPYTETTIPATKYTPEEIKLSPRKAFEDGLKSRYEDTLLESIKKTIQQDTKQQIASANEKITFLNEQISSQKKRELLEKEKKQSEKKQRELLIESKTDAEYTKEYAKYEAYTIKRAAFEHLIVEDTQINENLSSLPNTTSVFCPYCAKKISHRTGKLKTPGINYSEEVACKYIYSGDYLQDGIHTHECIATNKYLAEGRYRSAQSNCILPVGESYKNTLRDICSVCNGPVAYHDHFNLDTGEALNTMSLELCFNRVDRSISGILNASCLNEGGGGVLEMVARQLAYRDYAKEKILANPPGGDKRFGMKFQEMAVLADNYARIIRLNIKTKKFKNLYFDTDLIKKVLYRSIAPRIVRTVKKVKYDGDPEEYDDERSIKDERNVFKRAVTALGDGRWDEGLFDISDVVKDPIGFAPRRYVFNPIPKPDKEKIRARITKETPEISTTEPLTTKTTIVPKPKVAPKTTTKIATPNTNVVAIQAQIDEYKLEKSELEEQLEKIRTYPNSMLTNTQEAELMGDIEELDVLIASLEAQLPTGGSSHRRTHKLKKQNRRKTRLIVK